MAVRPPAACPRSGSQDGLSHIHTRVHAHQGKLGLSSSTQRRHLSLRLGNCQDPRAARRLRVGSVCRSNQQARANGPCAGLPCPPLGMHIRTHTELPHQEHTGTRTYMQARVHVHHRRHAGTKYTGHMHVCTQDTHAHADTCAHTGSGTRKGRRRRTTGLQNRSASWAVYTCPVLVGF